MLLLKGDPFITQNIRQERRREEYSLVSGSLRIRQYLEIPAILQGRRRRRRPPPGQRYGTYKTIQFPEPSIIDKTMCEYEKNQKGFSVVTSDAEMGIQFGCKKTPYGHYLAPQKKRKEGS